MSVLATSKARLKRKPLREQVVVLRASDFIGMEVNSSCPFDHPVCSAVERQMKYKGSITDLMPMFKKQYISINNTMYEVKKYYGRIEFTQDMKKAKAYGFTNVAVAKVELYKGEYIW